MQHITDVSAWSKTVGLSNKSFLVVGVDGTVGSAVAGLCGHEGIPFYATTRRREAAGAALYLDLGDPELADARLPQADIAVICAAANGFASCRANPTNAQRINAAAVRILGRRLTACGCRVIYLSSSAVFDFSRPHMSAAIPVCPTTVYGQSKAAGEQATLDLGPLGTVIRLTKVATPKMVPLGAWIANLQAGKVIHPFSDLHFCPISPDFIARAILTIAKADAGGIFQVSGASDISYFEAALHLANRLGLDNRVVVEARAVAHGIPREEIATFTSLDASRYEELSGIAAPAPFDVLDTVYRPMLAPVAVGSK
jgi:dTDP-4-dehydrorhamnose reductase